MKSRKYFRAGRRGEDVPEEEFPLVVRQRDALRRHFEMDHSRRGQWTGIQQVTHGPQDRLRTR